MKSRAKLATLLLGLVLGAGLAAATRLAAQDTPPPKPAHKPGPYEYKVVSLSYPDIKASTEWKEALEKHDKNELKADAWFKEYALNFYASEGWELVQVHQPKTELTVFYLKRAK